MRMSIVRVKRIGQIKKREKTSIHLVVFSIKNIPKLEDEGKEDAV
jgi:hypothetical protein